MDARQIWSILSSDSSVQQTNFLGVFPLDHIPKEALNSFPCSFVVNTKPHTHPGEHWVAVIKTDENRGVFFDSYGNPPSYLEEVLDVLDHCDDWTYNPTALQSLYSSVCGQYSIFFLTHFARGFTLEHIVFLLNDMGDRCANDAFIYNYIKTKYQKYLHNTELYIIDLPLIFNQIASITQ